MTTTYDCIATNLLTSPASSITFSGIPGTYTDLKIVVTGTVTVSTTVLNAQFNGDTATNYCMNTVIGTGSGAAGTDYTTSAQIYFSPWGAAQLQTGDQVNMATMDIFSYTNTSKYKTAMVTFAARGASAGGVSFGTGMWLSTAAITSVRIYPGGNQLATGTRASLYGIKAE